MVRVKIRQVEREYAEIESVADSLFRVDLGREWSDELIYQKKVAYADEKQRALNHFSMQIFVGKKREEN
jgi:hypothetical protein